MEVLALMAALFLVAGPRKSAPRRTAGAFAGPGGAAPDVGTRSGDLADVALQQACRQAGLTADECALVASGKVDQLASEGAEKLCRWLGLPGCTAVADVIAAAFSAPSWTAAAKLNSALNGGCTSNGFRSYFTLADAGATTAPRPETIVGPCKRFASGCVPVRECGGWSKCKPGTIPMGGWFSNARNHCP